MCTTEPLKRTQEAGILREWARRVRSSSWLQDAVQDVRYSARQFGRSPQLASAVVLTVVIGIALNSIAFSLFNGILFRAQVTRDPDSFAQTYSFVTGDSWVAPCT